MVEGRLASVVVNNHNYARFLAEAVDSALRQSWPWVEVIVVDDGSTDHSREVIAEYAGRVTAVLQDNAGQGAALNAGFDVSRGEVVIFLDADDRLHGDAVASVVPVFDDPCVPKVHWQLTVVDEAGRATGACNPTGVLADGELVERAVLEGPVYDSSSFAPTSGNAWARWFLDRVLPIPAAPYRLGADEYLHSVAPAYGPVRAVDGLLGDYREHTSNGYHGRLLDRVHVDELLGRLDSSMQALDEHLQRQRKVADSRLWRSRNFKYLWLERLSRALDDLATLVPEGGRFVLVDGDEWGGQLIPLREAVPLMGRPGASLGPPADDAAAIAALRAWHAQGVRIVAFWWTAAWWLEHYVDLRQCLDREATTLLSDDHLLVLDLGEKA